MPFKVSFAASLACVAFMLTGCTLLPIKNLQPLIAPPNGLACSAPVHLIADTMKASTFVYLLPDDAITSNARSVTMDRPLPLTSFKAYHDAVANRVQAKLGTDLANDAVVKAFTEVVASVSAEAQLDAQIADGTAGSTDVKSEFAAIRGHSAAPNLKYSQLKNFSNKLFKLQLKHTAADYTNAGLNPTVVNAAATAKSTLTQTTTTKPTFDNALIAYLKAYYDGKFYDRMGTAISKPTLPNSTNLVSSLSNFSVPDSEITAAETVLLEFLMDTVDPTPVMGNTSCPLPTTSASASCKPAANDPKSTTYYPGNSSNQPTALTVGLAKYVQLPATGCGITTQNAWVLQTLASGASDEAATVGGLIANTAGGVGVSAGVFAKISIGDNATLSDLVKTAASEVALRTTLLASYFSLYHVQFDPFQLPKVPALVPSPTSLTFAYTLAPPPPAPLSQTITITDPSGSGLGWTASSNASWLTGTSGTATVGGGTGTVAVTAKPDGLNSQTYTGTITLTPITGTAPAVSIPVTFTVSAP